MTLSKRRQVWFVLRKVNVLATHWPNTSFIIIAVEKKIVLKFIFICGRQESKNVRKISGRLISFASQNWSRDATILLKWKKLHHNQTKPCQIDIVKTGTFGQRRSSIFMTNAPIVDAKSIDILEKNKINILCNSAHISKLYKRVVVMNIISLLVLVLVLSWSMFDVVPIKILFSWIVEEIEAHANMQKDTKNKKWG